MKVLVTGGAGYIGSILTQQLLAENFEVKVLDNLFFGHEGLLPVYGHKNFQFIKGDIRDENILKRSLVGVDAVVNLAALVGEPLCKIAPEAAVEINQNAALNTLKLAKENGVKRLIFVSTCSNYGVSDMNSFVDETAELNPVSIYSETKVATEKEVMKASTDSFTACVLRFATVYGISPRMRFDLLLHEFLRDALVNKKIQIYGPNFWRPLTHVRDAVAACVKILSSDEEKIRNEVFNVGNTEENYTKLMLTEIIKKRLPETEIEILQGKTDPRNYRVSFDKISKKLDFKTQKTVEDGVEEIVSAVENKLLNPTEPEYTNVSDQVKNIKTFKQI